MDNYTNIEDFANSFKIDSIDELIIKQFECFSEIKKINETNNIIKDKITNIKTNDNVHNDLFNSDDNILHQYILYFNDKMLNCDLIINNEKLKKLNEKLVKFECDIYNLYNKHKLT